MAKKYVPEGVFLACDKGSSPSNLRVSNNEKTTIYAMPMATEADKLPFFNIKPCGLCASPAKWTTGITCLPMVLKWDNPKDGVKINGNRMLLEDSTCKCTFGGEIKIFFDRASAVAYGVGEGKMPSEYIKDAFDWAAEKSKEIEKQREALFPDWLEGIADVGDWVVDFNVGLVEGAINGVVGLGEVIYQVAQDPVGMGEAIGGMAVKGWNATGDALNSAGESISDATDWASKSENWSNTANDAWDWGSKPENWQKAGSNAVEGFKDGVSATATGIKDGAVWVAKNPRKISNTVGEFIPDAAAAYFSGGTSLALSAEKLAAKEALTLTAKELAEKGLQKAGKEVIKGTGEAVGKKTAKEILAALAKKEADDIAAVVTKDAAEKAAQHLDDALKNFDPLTATNKQKGNLGEMASHNNMLKNKNLKRLGDDAPSGLDDKIKKGIDGIYENADPPPDFIIDEAKYGKSALNQAPKDGPQMSDDWIKGSKRLEKQVGDVKANAIRDALKKGNVDRVLSKVDEAGNVTTYKINADGTVGGLWP